MNQKCFDIICDKVYNQIKGNNFSKNNVQSEGESQYAALYTSAETAYMVTFLDDKKQVQLRHCRVTDGVPDNEWYTLSTWMFDDATDAEKEANSIGNDFVDTLTKPVRKKTAIKKKKSEDGNADPLFFCKRMVNIFPELKEEIKSEEDCYYPFRGATFVKASVVPKINNLLLTGSKAEIKKLGDLLSNQYNNGDLDTRSIITMVVLNSIDSQQKEEKLEEYLSDDLSKSRKFANGFKGKKVKPEKPKKAKKTIVQRLEGSAVK